MWVTRQSSLWPRLRTHSNENPNPRRINKRIPHFCSVFFPTFFTLHFMLFHHLWASDTSTLNAEAEEQGAELHAWIWATSFNMLQFHNLEVIWQERWAMWLWSVAIHFEFPRMFHTHPSQLFVPPFIVLLASSHPIPPYSILWYPCRILCHATLW